MNETQVDKVLGLLGPMPYGIAIEIKKLCDAHIAMQAENRRKSVESEDYRIRGKRLSDAVRLVLGTIDEGNKKQFTISSLAKDQLANLREVHRAS